MGRDGLIADVADVSETVNTGDGRTNKDADGRDTHPATGTPAPQPSHPQQRQAAMGWPGGIA